MDINFIQDTPAPPPLKVVLELSVDEARKLRSIAGANSTSYYEALVGGSPYPRSAFPEIDDFIDFTEDLFFALHSHEETRQPSYGNDRTY